MQKTITRREALQRISMMLGGALSLPVLSGALAGCGAGTATGWAPQVLSRAQNDLVTTLAEIILPETDTPGAKAAGVNRFVDAILSDWYTAAERDRFLAGLARVEARAEQAYGRAFTECTPEQQVALVGALDRAAYPRPDPDAEQGDPAVGQGREAGGQGQTALSESGGVAVDGAPEDPVADFGGEQDATSFFRSMKELTLVGYYTSEIGATQELRVTPMGEYRGDVPYEEIGLGWA